MWLGGGSVFNNRVSPWFLHPVMEMSQLLRVHKNSREHDLNQRRKVAGFAGKVTMASTPLRAEDSAEQGPLCLGF